MTTYALVFTKQSHPPRMNFLSGRLLEKVHQAIEAVLVQYIQEGCDPTLDVLAFEFVLVNEKVSDHACKTEISSCMSSIEFVGLCNAILAVLILRKVVDELFSSSQRGYILKEL